MNECSSSSWVLPIFGLDVPCKHHCQGEEHTWKLPATLEGQFAQLAQSPGTFYIYPWEGWCVSKSIAIPTVSPSLQCIYYLSIQTAPPAIPTRCSYQFPPGVQLSPSILILGQFTLPIRDRKGRGGCEYVEQDTREDLTTFHCLQSQQLKMPVAFSISRAHISPFALSSSITLPKI